MSDEYYPDGDQVQGDEGGEGESTQPAGADNPVLQRAHKIAAEVGGLAPSDPEYKLIDQKTSDPFDFLESVKKAADAKKARTSGQPQQPAPAWQPSQQRATRNPIENIKDPATLIKMGLARGIGKK